MLGPDGTPLRREYVCPEDEEPVPSEEIVRGYEVEEGQWVLVSDEELEALEPRRSRDIDLRQFVRREELPPLFFQRAYFLAPSGDSSKAYRLLAATMEEKDRVGIATFVMRGKAYVVAIIAEKGVLRAETLRYADEVRSLEEIGTEVLPRPDSKEVRRIVKRIEKMTADELDPEEMRDEWAERVRSRAEEKLAQENDVIRVAEASPEEQELVDIMEVLKQRLGAQPDEEQQVLSEQTKHDLYDQAKTLDIPGRSKMTREELIDAIRSAS